MKGYQEKQGFLFAGGGIVDALIIHAPSSTKNKDKKRDPEMSSTKKGNMWHFAMKAQISHSIEHINFNLNIMTNNSLMSADISSSKKPLNSNA